MKDSPMEREFVERMSDAIFDYITRDRCPSRLELGSFAYRQWLYAAIESLGSYAEPWDRAYLNSRSDFKAFYDHMIAKDDRQSIERLESAIWLRLQILGREALKDFDIECGECKKWFHESEITTAGDHIFCQNCYAELHDEADS